MMRIVLAFLLLSVSAQTQAQVQPVTPPAIPGSVVIQDSDGNPVKSITQELGLPILLKAAVDGNGITWVVIDKGVLIEDGGFRGGDERAARADANRAGTYRVLAFTNKGNKNSKPATVTLVWIDKGPTPPIPPAPVPPAPVPSDDTLSKPLADAYASESSATKATETANVAKYYKSAGTICSTYKGTAKALYEQLRLEQPKWVVTDGIVPSVRAIVGHEFQKVMPTDPSATLTADQIAAAASIFTRSATILEGLK